MSMLFLAIPLTLFVLFVLPVWLWLHYNNRGANGSLTQNEQQRLLQLTDDAEADARTHSGAGSDPGCRTSELEGQIMAGLDLNKKLWRIPQRGMVKGVCAGIAQHLDVPVKLVRLITVLAMIFGLFSLSWWPYIILTFALDPIPDSELYGHKAPSNGDLLAAVDAELASGEQRLREMERYVTSDTFTLRSRFRQL
ncbi:phage shock protein C [Klebsiella pneumoniae]|nr:phage shock protein C [Klebsiella pneumoniae]